MTFVLDTLIKKIKRTKRYKVDQELLRILGPSKSLEPVIKLFGHKYKFDEIILDIMEYQGEFFYLYKC